MVNKEATIMAQFLKDNTKSKGISVEIAAKIEELVTTTRINHLPENHNVPHSIITADFGTLGSLCVRTILENEEITLQYESGSYGYVSILCNTKIILWTDFDKTEPYNRQSGLYADGSSWDSLELVKEKKDYREFHTAKEYQDYKSNISFGVWGYNYNNYWNSIKFGILLPTDKVETFINSLKALINK